MAPDSAVTGSKLWAMGAVILASTAALLGTSDVQEPQAYTRYEFRRDGIEGGTVELTVDRPSATFFVNVTANELSPEGVVTTDEAVAILQGTVETSGLTAGDVPPLVAVKVSTPQQLGGFEQRVADALTAQVQVPFSGNCSDPRTGVVCATRFSVEVRRLDDGEAGGKVAFTWQFDLASTGKERHPGEQDTQVGPFDPPWTVEVTEP